MGGRKFLVSRKLSLDLKLQTHQVPSVGQRNVAADGECNTVSTVNTPIEN